MSTTLRKHTVGPAPAPSLPEGDQITQHSTHQIHRIQIARGEAPCFRTDARYTCNKLNCPLCVECRRRIAAWRR
ncbi:hypothetical protein BJI67_05170 [Acidihalobacter aeolianus]|uniref:Uncharacterized protein n=1 Tax=Acidihalobacter aeolianus TaxID=2792603 RepID=A0A1D8K6F3_9GAMM|nr:hypothetical protein [Acidihalobacter aeolianus]AOV16542.1 hypothetical protein BJI67_05170 [Acidihalobacter aeolianus]